MTPINVPNDPYFQHGRGTPLSLQIGSAPPPRLNVLGKKKVCQNDLEHLNIIKEKQNKQTNKQTKTKQNKTKTKKKKQTKNKKNKTKQNKTKKTLSPL